MKLIVLLFVDGNDEEGNSDEPVRNEEQVRGEYVRVQLKDGIFRDVFIPSNQSSERPDNRLRRDRGRRFERERAQKNDNERRMTKKE